MNYAARTARYFRVMRYQHRLLWLALPLVVWAGCRKDSTNEAPSIEILQPGDGSTLTLPDTLRATLRVSDDASVEHVSISLVDAQGVAITAGVGASPSGNPATVVLEMPIGSERIESGTYTLVATASDGNSDAHAYRSVHVTGIPQRLRAVFAVTSDGGTVGLSKIDSAGNISAVTSWGMDLGGAAVSSYDQTLFISGSVTGPFLAIAPDDHAERWQKPNMGSLGAPYFSALGLGGDTRPYIGTSDGYLRAYNTLTGLGEFTAGIPTNFQADHVLVIGEQVYCAMHHLATQQQRIIVYQRSSGAVAADQLIDFAPVALFQRSANALLFFANADGHGVVEERSLELGGAWQPYVWSQPIVAAQRMSDDKWAVALADGTLDFFTYSTASALTVGNMPGLGDMAYDPLNSALYAAAGTQVLAINSITGQVVATYPIGNEVRYVLPLYNR